MTTDANSSDRMIKLPEVISVTGLSRSSIYLLIKKGEINSWLESRPRGSQN